MRRIFRAILHSDVAQSELEIRNLIEQLPADSPTKPILERNLKILVDLNDMCLEANELVLAVLGDEEAGSANVDLEYGFWGEEEVVGHSTYVVEHDDIGDKGDAFYLSEDILAMLAGTFVARNPEDESEVEREEQQADPPFAAG